MKISKIPGVKKFAVLWCFILIFQIFFPTMTWALTGGPSQPEVQSFEPMGTTQMVDLQSGDFNYNIPLLSVGAYPINLAYHAGVSMEQEASWVGLGWNINPGAINRNMRGLPDDFSGEEITKELDTKNNITVEFGLGPEFELGGFGLLSLSTGIRYNNYKGLALTQNVNVAMEKMGAFKLNLGLGFDTGNGVSITPSVGLSHTMSMNSGKSTFTAGINIGAPYNSRSGLQELTFSRNFSRASGKLATNKYARTIGIGTSGSLITFNTPSYITSTENNSKSFAFNLKIGIGGELLPFADTKVDFKGSFSKLQTLGDRTFPAFGYLYHDRSIPGISMMDFNREKDGPYYKASNTLPLTNVTFDSYSVAGQGVGGAYRLHRNDIGYIQDAVSTVDNSHAEFGADIAPGTFPISFKIGLNLSSQQTDGRSGIWSNQNQANNLYYYGKRPANTSNSVQSKYESTYFKQIGELTSNKGRFERLQKGDPLHFDLTGSNKNPTLTSTIKDAGGNTRNITAVEADRAIRNQPLSALTINEAKKGAIQKKVQHYHPGLQLDAEGRPQKTEMTISNYIDGLGDVKDNQLFEMIANRSDGMRYVYGLPAYNLLQQDVTFNPSSGATKNYAKPSVTYSSSDISDNDNGVDHYFMREIMPGYAYSHLLTNVLSADYSDRTGDGPSDDDYGDWVKLNYTNVAGHISGNQPYKWRLPFEEFNSGNGIANFGEGLKSKTRDDKANFTYGEKELWYTHSIESRSHIAIFYTSNRNDAKGVKNSDGRTDGSSSRPSMQKLDKIAYYAKNDLALEGTNAVPIKTIHFEYDYSLCPGVPNNLASGNGGKLTLKKLYFHYGNSRKGEFSKYKFGYFEDANNDNIADFEYQNPPYKRRDQDRWGNYKKDLLTSSAQYAPSAISDPSIPLANSDFPYAEQDEQTADESAQAWNLKTVELPSGGTIGVTYESDDYAFVQDKRANQMFTLTGTAESPPSSLSQVNQNGRLHEDGDFYNYLVVELPELLNSLTLSNDDEFYHEYLDGQSNLYFRTLVHLKNGKYEFVPGYTKIDNHGTFQDGGKDYGWIKLKGVGYDDNETGGSVNPIAKAAWQFARTNMPTLVYPGSDVEAGLIQNVIQGMVGLILEIPRMLSGFNRSLRREGFCKRLVPGKSWLRLNTPDYVKKGGGSRVQKIQISDNWSTMNDVGENAVYGQQFFYQTLESTSGGEEKLISSGVATYEPILGNDENPFRQPVTFNEARWLAPDNHHYIEKPMGESFFPSASVGYSKVVVADIRPDENINRTATGYKVNEYYTARDFPYKTLHDVGERKLHKPSPLSSLFRFRTKDYAHVSQGYSIELNDMHGKQKAMWNYGGALPYSTETGELELTPNVLAAGNRLSGTEYLYLLDDNNQLENKVDVLNPDGSIDQDYVGVESEMSLDFRENRTSTSNIEIRADLDMWIITIPLPPFLIPIPVFSIIPAYSESETLFRSAVTTKVINKHGLLDKVRVHQEGSIIETENLLYDSETGEVLLTTLNNEFNEHLAENDPLANEENMLYSLKYPAHWAYDGMGPAYQNIGATQDLVSNSSGNIFLSQAEQIFEPGDEVLGTGTLTFSIGGFDFDFPYSQKLWVSKAVSNNVSFIFSDGELLNSSYEVFPGDPNWSLGNDWNMKIVRSGYRNQQSVPIANLNSLKNPATFILGSGSPNSGNQSLTSQANALGVIDFSAEEYSDKWQMFCNGTEIVTTECICNASIDNLEAISSLLTQQYENGELWTTQNSNISAIVPYEFPWVFDPSECAYQHQHYSSTDLSHVRTMDHTIGNLKVPEKRRAFVTSEYVDPLVNASHNVMAYTIAYNGGDQIEAIFHNVEGNPTNSIETLDLKQFSKPEGAQLEVVELIDLRKSTGDQKYALLSAYQTTSNQIGALITVFDQNNVIWSKEFIGNGDTPMDLSTWDGSSFYYTYFSGKTKTHHIAKLNAATGTLIYDYEIKNEEEYVGEDKEVLPMIISNKGNIKKDQRLLVRSTIVNTSKGKVNRLFVHRVKDGGEEMSIDKTFKWDINKSEADTTRFIPMDIIKMADPYNTNNGKPIYYHFAAGKTTENKVFLMRIEAKLDGSYYTFEPNIDVKSVAISHSNDPGKLTLNISPQVDAQEVESAMTMEVYKIFEESFTPVVDQIYRFDHSNAVRASTIDGVNFSDDRTLYPTLQIDPVYSTGKFRVGNFDGANGHLETIGDCFDEFVEPFIQPKYNKEATVDWNEKDLDQKTIDVKLTTTSRPDLEDFCCPETITHFVSWSRDCDTCSYTFHLPDNADYCLMDLGLIEDKSILVVPDYEEIENADCDANDHQFYTFFEVNDPSSSFYGQTVEIIMTSNCFEPFECREEQTITLCGGEDGTIINPYVHGVRGNWRAQRSYVHKAVKRVGATAMDQADIRQNGYYEEFDQFWNRPNSPNEAWTKDDQHYVRNVEITKYSPYGEPLEENDALGIPSAVLTGYDKKLPIAVGGNMKYREMAFDGFEEYAFYEAPDQCHAGFHFDMNAYSNLDEQTVHSGFYSMKVQDSHEASFKVECPEGYVGGNSTPTPFGITRCEDCLPSFSPTFKIGSEEENRYVFDCWVNQGNDQESIIIRQLNNFGSVVATTTLSADGPKIENWRRVYGFFKIEPNVTEISFEFNNEGITPLYVDDVRVYPFDGNMNSFVYHPSSLKLMAELDENNHATFYEYDEEWNLIRIKKETERGIITLEEHRNHERVVRD